MCPRPCSSPHLPSLGCWWMLQPWQPAPSPLAAPRLLPSHLGCLQAPSSLHHLHTFGCQDLQLPELFTLPHPLPAFSPGSPEPDKRGQEQLPLDKSLQVSREPPGTAPRRAGQAGSWPGAAWDGRGGARGVGTAPARIPPVAAGAESRHSQSGLVAPSASGSAAPGHGLCISLPPASLLAEQSPWSPEPLWEGHSGQPCPCQAESKAFCVTVAGRDVPGLLLAQAPVPSAELDPDWFPLPGVPWHEAEAGPSGHRTAQVSSPTVPSPASNSPVWSAVGATSGSWEQLSCLKGGAWKAA